MNFKPPYAGNDVANSSDLPAVVVCFQDPEIGELFADLLTSRGVTPIVMESLKSATVTTKIVTEPCFFPELTPDQAKNCLVVGPKRSLKTISARCLEQPLTEAKVEIALDFLTLPIQLR